MVRASKVVHDRNETARHVGDHVWHEEGGNSVWFEIVDELGLVVHRLQTADARADEDTKFVLQLIGKGDIGILKSHCGGCDCVQQEGVHAAGVFLVDPVAWFKIRNFSRNLAGVELKVFHLLNPADTRLTSNDLGPKDIDTGAERGDRSNSGDDDTPGWFGQDAH